MVKHIGVTTRRLEQRVKEHQDACKRGDEKVSAIAEHAWQQHHPIKWEEVRVVDRATKNRELKIEESLHTQMILDNNKRPRFRASRMLAVYAACKSPFRI